MKNLKTVISVIIGWTLFFGVYFYLYMFISINIGFLFIPEFTFFYGFLSLFLLSFFVTMDSYYCLAGYSILAYITIRQYFIVLKAGKFVIFDYWLISPLTVYIKILLLILVFIILLFMYLLEDKHTTIFLCFESLILILLCISGIIIFLSTVNLFVIYLGIELQSLALYILCCLKRYSNKSIEAGLKYYIYGSYASLVLLLGVSLIYLSLGTLNINDINMLINIINCNNNELLHVGLCFILIGFFFKLAVAPFHWWLADIFEGSPDIITFFLAIVPKLPFFYVLYQLYILIYSNFYIYSYILIILGLSSIIIGTLLGLYVVKMKKLFAYSSIVHMGYMVLALGLSSDISGFVAFYYFLIYLLSTVNLFSIYLLIRNSHSVVFGNVTDLVYLRSSNKLLALIAIVSLLSLAGIPPFMGFYGKLFIFNLLIVTGNYVICLLLLLLSILSCVYYIRLVRFIFFDDKNEEPIIYQKVKSIYIYWFIVFFFLLNSIFLFFQEPLLLYIINIF